jgi:hypothetical protein
LQLCVDEQPSLFITVIVVTEAAPSPEKTLLPCGALLLSLYVKPPPPLALTVTLPVAHMVGCTMHTVNEGVVFGAGVIELLEELVHPPTVLVAVTAVVVVTLIGFVVAPLLQVNSLAEMLTLLPSFAVIVVVPSQLSTFDKTGAAGVVFGAGVIELLAELVHPFTVLVAVTEVVVVTLIGLVVAPLLQVNSLAEMLALLPSFAVIVVVPSQLSTFDKTGAKGVEFTVSTTDCSEEQTVPGEGSLHTFA